MTEMVTPELFYVYFCTKSMGKHGDISFLFHSPCMQNVVQISTWEVFYTVISCLFVV